MPPARRSGRIEELAPRARGDELAPRARGDELAAGAPDEPAELDWTCQHYRCRRADVTPILYEVLGASFLRLLCPRHDPAVQAGAATTRAA